MQIHGTGHCFHADEECGGVWAVVGRECCCAVGRMSNTMYDDMG